jgi:hypothetical protein
MSSHPETYLPPADSNSDSDSPAPAAPAAAPKQRPPRRPRPWWWALVNLTLTVAVALAAILSLAQPAGTTFPTPTPYPTRSAGAWSSSNWSWANPLYTVSYNGMLPSNIEVYVIGERYDVANDIFYYRVQTKDGGRIVEFSEWSLQSSISTYYAPTAPSQWTLYSALFNVQPLGDIPIYSVVTIIEIRKGDDGDLIYVVEDELGAVAEATYSDLRAE